MIFEALYDYDEDGLLCASVTDLNVHAQANDLEELRVRILEAICSALPDDGIRRTICVNLKRAVSRCLQGGSPAVQGGEEA